MASTDGEDRYLPCVRAPPLPFKEHISLLAKQTGLSKLQVALAHVQDLKKSVELIKSGGLEFGDYVNAFRVADDTREVFAGVLRGLGAYEFDAYCS